MNDDGKMVILQAMMDFPSSVEVQSLCCQVLGNIAIAGNFKFQALGLVLVVISLAVNITGYTCARILCMI